MTKMTIAQLVEVATKAGLAGDLNRLQYVKSLLKARGCRLVWDSYLEKFTVYLR